ncbi:hypothetical protein NHX12_020438 [Muraenolepis orangiensis]|uniref:Reverse transcriptase domain-containing protein n=1 Tax=Muraenolepis orangiensis TaxID=630683 RepID=A0A9Q0IWN3_9TELE|nr:hypothetical protein NHX12_020438 [Muraenolepis orangiensis]
MAARRLNVFHYRHGLVNGAMSRYSPILERMIHSRIEPVVDSQLPREQAGFRRGRSTADQVTLLCQDLEDSFQDNEKAGVVYLDLTAAYDTVWHRGLHLKLLRTIPDRHMVKFIMETLSNCSFILQTSSGQCSRLRRLKNGVPQGSVLSPMLFNVYIHDLPDTASRKYGYADDLAIMLSRPMWKAMEEGLNEDMGTLVAYLRRWRLQLSVGKSVAAAYHLSTREARRELEVRVDNKCLEVQQAPKYLGVRLDRTLSFKQHLEEVKAKVTSRVALLRRLAGTTWGASAKTLRISQAGSGILRPSLEQKPSCEKEDVKSVFLMRFLALVWLQSSADGLRSSSPVLAARGTPVRFIQGIFHAPWVCADLLPNEKESIHRRLRPLGSVRGHSSPRTTDHGTAGGKSSPV